MSAVEQSLLEEAARDASPSALKAAARALAVGQAPARRAFVARVLSAVAHLAAAIDDVTLNEATAATSRYEVLVIALSAPEALAALSGPRRTITDGDDVPSPEETDLIFAEARQRGLREREWLVQAEGGVWSVEDVAHHLHISRQAVDKRRQKGRLIGLRLGRRGYAYPAWQFTREGTVPGLEMVLNDLQGFNPWTQAAFMLHGNVRLDRRVPLADLRAGRLDEVRRAARAYGEQGSA